MARIFWVEDQSHWVERFRPLLLGADLDSGDNHLQVFRFSDQARQHIALATAEDAPDIAILDAHMNGYDQAGFSISSALQKKWPGLPIVFLSEHSGTELERDALMQHAARDFIAKHQPNVEEVLCWRLKAALRQAALQAAPAQGMPEGVLVSGGLRLDTATWQIFWHGVRLMNPDNPRRPLAPTPRKMLRCLLERSPRPVSTAQMGDYLHGAPADYAHATYRQHIKTLRRAFDAAEGGQGSFMQRCRQGSGIVTFSGDGAYQWLVEKPDA